MEIPAGKLRDIRLTSTKSIDPGLAFMMGAAALLVKAEQKALMIQYQDSSGTLQIPLFHFLVNTKHELDTLPDQACANISNLMLNAKKEIINQDPPDPQINNSQAAFFCKYCGNKNDIDAIWCQSCGKKIKTDNPTPMAPTTLFCQSCGSENKSIAVFCKKCGTQLKR